MIAFDLVAVSPMSSMTGNLAYVQYVKGTTKGESTQGDLVNNIWQLGNVDQNYTGDKVVENVAEAGDFVPAWNPVVGNKVVFVAEDGTETEIEGVDGKFAIPAAGRVKYVYDNVIIPQETLPTLKAELKNIGLEAKARRIAVFYSQIAAFQAKTDYGFDLADGLAEQAVSQLSYEIDTEIVNMLVDAAKPEASIKDWSKTLPVGVSLADHYAGFAAKLEEYKMAIFQRTKKFTPNFMVVAPDVMPVIQFVPGFQSASVSDVTGPYFAGTLNGLKVYVSPNVEVGTIALGVNQGALQASAGVYAPLENYALIA